MLGIYFTVILCMFIVMIVGAVIGYSQSLSEVKKPLEDSMDKYDVDATDSKAKGITKAWDDLQMDVSNFLA